MLIKRGPGDSVQCLPGILKLEEDGSETEGRQKGESGKEAVGETARFPRFVLVFRLYQMPENKATMGTFHSSPIYNADSVYLWQFS